MPQTQTDPQAGVRFDASPEEYRLIKKIVTRAFKAKLVDGTRKDLDMDLSAVHANGMPLDFEKLLAFDDFNFNHDVCGIRRHINRDTGKLGGFFVPRCAKPER